MEMGGIEPALLQAGESISISGARVGGAVDAGAPPRHLVQTNCGVG